MASRSSLRLAIARRSAAWLAHAKSARQPGWLMPRAIRTVYTSKLSGRGRYAVEHKANIGGLGLGCPRVGLGGGRG